MNSKILIIAFLLFSACKAENNKNIDCIESFLIENDASKSECAIQRLMDKIKLKPNVMDMVALGNVYVKLGDSSRAKKHYKKAILEGDSVDAMYNLAQIYFEEELDAREFKNTVRYMGSAAKHGLPEAQLSLSYIYAEYLKEKNFNVAISYLKSAANNNAVDESGYVADSVINAQLALAKVYLSGIWQQEKDLNKGKYWSKKALKNRSDNRYKVNE